MIFKRVIEDMDAVRARDPAAHSRLEVMLCYPGLHAILLHRLTHRLWRRGWRLSARLLSHLTRMFTAIEIHPAAQIGRRFVIDHGNGVVIGETSQIGDDVTFYHGVTLGGIAPAVDAVSQVDRKRHPTIEDGVIVGSGAQILGPIRVGACARVGANAVVTKDVPPAVTVVGIPARVIMPRDRHKTGEFVAYGTPANAGPDPVVQSLEALRAEIAALKERVGELEARPAAGDRAATDPAEGDGRGRPAVVVNAKPRGIGS